VLTLGLSEHKERSDKSSFLQIFHLEKNQGLLWFFGWY